MSLVYVTHSLAETDALAAGLAEAIREPLTIALNGTLGAGKTRLVQGLVAALAGEPIQVTSPTFTLWNTYPTRPLVHHLDAYRLESEEEFWELGIDEYFETSGIVIIEWADKFPEVLPEDSLVIDVKVVDESTRSWHFDAHRPHARRCLRRLQELDPVSTDARR